MFKLLYVPPLLLLSLPFHIPFNSISTFYFITNSTLSYILTKPFSHSFQPFSYFHFHLFLPFLIYITTQFYPFSRIFINTIPFYSLLYLVSIYSIGSFYEFQPCCTIRQSFIILFLNGTTGLKF